MGEEVFMTGFLRKTLPLLIQSLPGFIPMQITWEGDLPSTPVTGVTYNSREVQRGYLFFAVKGTKVDGHEYIPDAVERGAAAVVGSYPLQGLAVPYLRVEEPREALAYFAAAFYNHPARNMAVIGVTGTDGKTTTSNLIYQIMIAAGYPAGIISTVNAVIGDEVVDTGFHVTTPEAPDVQRYLARMRTAGLSHLVLESTSHGLAQHRVTGCEFDIGVVTNITHEHLDYHGSFHEYRAAKARLFQMLSQSVEKDVAPRKLAVLNRDDDSYAYLREVTKVPSVAYGFSADADVGVEQVSYTPQGIQMIVRGPGFRHEVRSSMVGPYNVSNILAAVSATVIGLGISPTVAASGVAEMRGIPGRMEVLNLGQSFLAIVDFAHTPNALLQVLNTARQMTTGRVIAVFGSAGLRDREKRRMMAEVSVKSADLSIFTAEDPRTESLDAILAEMADGAEELGGLKGKDFLIVPDRREALRQAVRLAQSGDMVISCGKGHEQSMCFGDTEYAWDDRTAVRAALAELLKQPGPEMPYLPDLKSR
jgi:UDP-N-acetylmuramoyl-L-alanyl-D-glutamate--2,6-diaminopimelate ligase